MLRNKKLISIIATLAFCLSFLAPLAFAPVAQAADMYSVIKTGTFLPNANLQNPNAAVKVVIPETSVLAGSRVTVSMPSDWTFGANTTANVVATTPNAGDISIVGAAGNGTNGNDEMLGINAFGAATFNLNPNKTFDIVMAPAATITQTGGNQYFYIYFNGININNMTGDMNVTFFAPSGSVFQTGQVTLGKSSRGGSTLTSIKKVNTLTDNGGTLDIISVSELQAGTLTAGGVIKMKILTKGAEWDTTLAGAYASYGWDFTGTLALGASLEGLTGANTAFSTDNKELRYTVASANTGAPGRISFGSLGIIIDDAEAKAGEPIKVRLSGADMTETTIEVANYAEYGLSIASGTSKNIIAGQDDQTVGNWILTESSQGSLIVGRTIKIKLPTGAKWNAMGDDDVQNSSDIGAFTCATNTDLDVLTLSIATASTTGGAVVDFNDFTVDLSPAFSGALEATVSGTAGLSGTLKLADVSPSVVIAAANAQNVNLGQANQALGEITLTEGKAEGLNDGCDLVLLLDEGYRWSKVPTVAVTEGDINIDESGVKVDGRELKIPIDGQSSIASKITITNAFVDAFRTAPEGAIYLTVASTQDAGYGNGPSAIMNFIDADYADKNGGKALVGTCVTPAETTSSNASFYIGSTIMSVNGSNVVMDAAPYIKAGRTYVPVRYLGDSLGATTAWDAATQTVTVTKGDKTVVLVIGSKTAKVNGADVAMDVAPEITNGRTMLPARYVAEGLGYAVGWNAALQQVVIQ